MIQMYIDISYIGYYVIQSPVFVGVFWNPTQSSLFCDFQMLPTQYLPHFPHRINIMAMLGVTFQTENICIDEMLTIDSCSDDFLLPICGVKNLLKLEMKRMSQNSNLLKIMSLQWRNHQATPLLLKSKILSVHTSILVVDTFLFQCIHSNQERKK